MRRRGTDLFLGIVLGIMFTTAVSAGRCMNSPGTVQSENIGNEEDFRSPEALVKALYESLTFVEGESPNLIRFASLFSSEAAPCIRATPGSLLVTDLRGFLENFGERMRTGALRSFREEEVSGRLDVYGNAARVLSVYRKVVNSTDPAKAVRGVNFLQLFAREGRWRIVSLVWQDETADNPIPERFLEMNLVR